MVGKRQTQWKNEIGKREGKEKEGRGVNERKRKHIDSREHVIYIGAGISQDNTGLQ